MVGQQEKTESFKKERSPYRISICIALDNRSFDVFDYPTSSVLLLLALPGESFAQRENIRFYWNTKLYRYIQGGCILCRGFNRLFVKYFNFGSGYCSICFDYGYITEWEV